MNDYIVLQFSDSSDQSDIKLTRDREFFHKSYSRSFKYLNGVQEILVYEIDKGIIGYINKVEYNGLLHRDDCPALVTAEYKININKVKSITPLVSFPYLLFNDRPADKQPKVIGAKEIWYQHGKKHREEDLPSIVEHSQNKKIEKWCYEGLRHRNPSNGAAYIEYDNNNEVIKQKYYREGVRVRLQRKGRSVTKAKNDLIDLVNYFNRTAKDIIDSINLNEEDVYS